MFNTGLEQFILYCAITESLGEPVYQVSQDRGCKSVSDVDVFQIYCSDYPKSLKHNQFLLLNELHLPVYCRSVLDKLRRKIRKIIERSDSNELVLAELQNEGCSSLMSR